MLQRLGRCQQVQARIDVGNSVEAAGLAQHVAAREFGRLDIGQVDRGALAGDRALAGAAVYLHTAYAQAACLRVDFHLLLARHGPGYERAGGHRAEALDGKDAVDRQAEVAAGILLRHRSGRSRQFAPQVVEAGAR